MAAKIYILSGSQFGGESVEMPESEITLTDKEGNKWVYDSSLSESKNTADLREVIYVEGK